MKKILCLLSVLLLFNIVYAQEHELKEITYSEFFKMIEEEEGEVFKYENAIVTFNHSTDTLFLVNLKNDYSLIDETSTGYKPLIIDKKIELNDVHFPFSIAYGKDLQIWGSIANIHFMQSIKIYQTESIALVNCIFEKPLEIRTDKPTNSGASLFNFILNSRFNSGVTVDLALQKDDRNNAGYIQIQNNTFINRARSNYDFPIISISGEKLALVSLKNNTFSDLDLFKLELDQTANIIFSQNKSEGTPFEISISANEGNQEVEITDNITDTPVLIKMEVLEPHFAIPFMQFNKGLFSAASYSEFIQPLLSTTDIIDYFPLAYSDSVFDLYANNHMYDSKKTFDREMALMGSFYSFYKEKFARMDANAVFIQMKDMETKKLLKSYQENPSFNSLFSIRINQFLKIFSAYGTEPARAIIFSLYIILIFAFIYLLFPNSWDVHGKNRIIHRFTFFMKYLNRKQGAHEVYLEDKQDEIMEYEEYKSLIESSSHKVPGFFKAMGLPLYRWAISGTRITASFLSRVDVLKGTWEEVPQKNRWWKFILITGAFLIAIIYDLCIKILNALMLSINTFTTLGFGEIPIKGFARYLAIIQGFIGWFMLTIFSVALISQLLD